MPPPPNPLDVAVESAGRDDHGTGMEFEGLSVVFADTSAAGDRLVRGQQALYAVGETDFESAASRMAPQLIAETRDEFLSGAPDDVEAQE